jgi:hypothetical protein
MWGFSILVRVINENHSNHHTYVKPLYVYTLAVLRLEFNQFSR